MQSKGPASGSKRKTRGTATRPKRAERRALPRARLSKVFAALDRAFPDARLELDFSNPLELLVALILAAQSRDVAVNSITRELFHHYRTAAEWAAADPRELEHRLRRINFHRTKAAGIREACGAIAERFGGRVPENLDDLLTLPRVGRKTANVLLANAFEHDVIGVDTHVARLSQRLAFTTATDPDRIEMDLMKIVPKGRRVRFTHLLQIHGRRICMAKRPKCPECPIEALCSYEHKTRVETTNPRRRARRSRASA